MTSRPKFFATPERFRAWLDEHGSTKAELIVGFHKKASGKPSMTWAESVDEALCFGWIDGVRKRIDEHSYQIRFSPRKPVSIWSAINIDRAEALARDRRMKPAGAAAFARRIEERSRTYSYEQADVAALERTAKRLFRGEPEAWSYFKVQAPSYRKMIIWRIVSAKHEATRDRRKAQLIEASNKRKRL